MDPRLKHSGMTKSEYFQVKKIIIFLLVFTITTFWFIQAEAREDVEKNKNNFFSKFKENLIVKKEIILESAWSDQKSDLSNKNSLGFEALKRFSSKKRDWASALVQLRFVQYAHEYMLMNTTPMSPSHVEGIYDGKIELHDAYFKYSGPFKGRLNFRIGHFDVPFGLEENTDTHSTLVQLISTRNIGFKKDWGLSILGEFSEFDYNFSITRGSGIEFIDKGDNFLLSGRIGTPSTENFVIGISALYGEVRDSMGIMRGMHMTNMTNYYFNDTTRPGDDIVRRYRVGLDGTFIYGPYTFKSEASFGEDVDQSVINGLVEIDYLFAGMDDKLEAVAQVQSAYQDIPAAGGDNDTFLTLGLNYMISYAVNLQASFRHDLQRLKNTENENIVGLRLYCYF